VFVGRAERGVLWKVWPTVLDPEGRKRRLKVPVVDLERARLGVARGSSVSE
jgi:hypothetical protein